MFFRLFIVKDEGAADRGFSLAGLKMPLPSFCPVDATPEMVGLDGNSIFLKTAFTQFWEIPTSFLIQANPALAKHLRGLDALYVPVDWCDVAPVDSTDQIWNPRQP
jgi:hypothetical protein